MKDIPYKIYLTEEEMPRYWYNVRADMKTKPAPLLNPATLRPMTQAELEQVFCRELAVQELDDRTPYIEIPPGGPEFLPDVPSLPLGSGLLSGGKAPDSGKDLLQVRGQQHLRLPQAQFHHRPGLLRQKAGPARRHHGDGSWPVGHGPEHGLRLPGA